MDSDLAVQVCRAFDRVESNEFDFHVGLASGFSVYLSIAESDPAFVALKEAAKDEGVRLAIRGRICELLVESFDERYQHPRDAALAAYLVILTSVSDVKGAPFVEKLASDSMHMFWAKRAALHVISGTIFPP